MSVLKIPSDHFKECPASEHSVSRDVLVDVMKQFFRLLGCKHEGSVRLCLQPDPRDVFSLEIDCGNDRIDFFPWNLDILSDVSVGIEFKCPVTDHDLAVVCKAGEGSSFHHKVSFMIDRLYQSERPFLTMNRSYHIHFPV